MYPLREFMQLSFKVRHAFVLALDVGDATSVHLRGGRRKAVYVHAVTRPWPTGRDVKAHLVVLPVSSVSARAVRSVPVRTRRWARVSRAKAACCGRRLWLAGLRSLSLKGVPVMPEFSREFQRLCSRTVDAIPLKTRGWRWIL